MSHSNFQSLFARLSQSGTAVPPDISQLLADVTALLEALPPGGNFNFLKKPGAWKSKPLPSNLPTDPAYVNVPCGIEIVNYTPAQLAAVLQNLTPTADPYGNALVTFPLLLR